MSGLFFSRCVSNDPKREKTHSDKCVPSLRKHAYSNTYFTTKTNENFQIKNSDIFHISAQKLIFHISAQNIDCGYSLEPPRRGGSNEYPQSVFWSRIKENNVYPFKPQLYSIKWGLAGSKLYYV